MDLAEYRQQSHDTWERMAAGWDGWNEMVARASRPVTDHMVAALAPKPGETILELACGAGVSGFAAAALMGGEGRLIMTDFASHMVEACERRGRELGFENIEYCVLDAERMDLADDSVDGVLCRWGYMLMADPAAALRETRRVLRSDGRVSFSVWAYLMELVGAISRVLAELDSREVAEIRSDTQTGLERFKTGSGYDLPGV